MYYCYKIGNNVQSVVATNIIMDLLPPGIDNIISPSSNGLYGTQMTVTFDLLSRAQTQSVIITLTQTSLPTNNNTSVSVIKGSIGMKWFIVCDATIESIGSHSVILQTNNITATSSIIQISYSSNNSAQSVVTPTTVWSSMTNSSSSKVVYALISGATYDVTIQYTSNPGTVTTATISNIAIGMIRPYISTFACGLVGCFYPLLMR
jgi:hypothetical protein